MKSYTLKNPLIFIALLALFACKQGSRKDNSDEQTTSNKEENHLMVVLEVKVKEDDVFEIYYYESGEKTFSPHKFVDTKINGKDSIQQISFDLPENIVPERLRLDFGKNINQKEINFFGIKLVYGAKEYRFTQEEIANQFKPSKYVLFDPESNRIKTMVINGSYDPYFYTMKVGNIVNYLMED